ncbi:MAG: hypothetical protein HZA46_19560, partial [Planctomycetales bacterium]|nr:hypothetical protein [Planctomycetales bacterium]
MLAVHWAKQLTRRLCRCLAPVVRSRRKSSRLPVHMERLESRSLPSGLVIQFDFSLDANNFFNTQAKKDLLSQAAQVFTNRIADDLTRIQPNVNIGNTWDALVTNPASGNQTILSNLSISTDTIRVYPGGRDLLGDTLAESGPGGFNVAGAQDWINTVTARGQTGAIPDLPSFKTDVGPWGGSMTFDTVGTNWYFGATTDGLGATQTDFLTVAIHELGHVLAFGTSDSFDNRVSGPPNGRVFNGSKSVARFGGPVPLSDPSHWGESVTDGGLEPAMNPIVHAGTRKSFSELDFLSLDDIGWTLSSGNVRMFRTYAPSVDYHFFTTSTAEFNSVVAGGGYRDETTNQQGFTVPDTKVGGAVGIHRMYNPNNGRHYYTAADNERNFLETQGWRFEKDEGNIFTTQVTDTTEVFRLYNVGSGVHLYTESAATKDAILSAYPGIWFQHASLGFAYVAPPSSSFPMVPAAETSATGAGRSAAATSSVQ